MCMYMKCLPDEGELAEGLVSGVWADIWQKVEHPSLFRGYLPKGLEMTLW